METAKPAVHGQSVCIQYKTNGAPRGRLKLQDWTMKHWTFMDRTLDSDGPIVIELQTRCRFFVKESTVNMYS